MTRHIDHGSCLRPPSSTTAPLRQGVLCLCLTLAAPLVPRPAGAEAKDMRPPPMRAVQVTEKRGEVLPLDRDLKGEDGQVVPLASLFDGRRPVLLTLAYIDCPMLCSLVLRGLGAAVRRLEHQIGVDYRLATIAIDPTETLADARARRDELNKGVPSVAGKPGWRYLRGRERDIEAIADALGFGYAWDERSERYAHPAVAFVLTGEGTITHYFHGVTFEPQALDAALDTAAGGALGTRVGQSVLSCFRFDPALRRHRAQVQALFRVGSASVLGGLLSLVAGLFIWERRRRR